MKKIKYPEVLEMSKVDLTKFQLEYALRGILKLSKTELDVLAYVFLHGRKAVEIMKEREIVMHEKTVENYITGFRKKGIIVGFSTETRLNENIQIFLEDIEYTIQIKLKDNEDNTIL